MAGEENTSIRGIILTERLANMQKSLDDICNMVRVVVEKQVNIAIEFERVKNELNESARKIVANEMDKVFRNVRELEGSIKDLQMWRWITVGAVGILSFIGPLAIKYFEK